MSFKIVNHKENPNKNRCKKNRIDYLTQLIIFNTLRSTLNLIPNLYNTLRSTIDLIPNLYNTLRSTLDLTPDL